MTRTTASSRAPAEVQVPRLDCSYIQEPFLEFARGKQHIDPKLGILRYGPRSLGAGNQHPSTVRVGFIGTAEGIEKSHEWIAKTSLGYPGDEKHPEFPGYADDRGFFSQLHFDSNWNSQLTRSEIDDLLRTRMKKRDRFEGLLKLLDAKLALLARKDLPPQYIILSILPDIYQQCRVVDYSDPALGQVHRDLRRSFKAIAMRYRIPTQILKERTAQGLDDDHYSKIAWNFFTGLYFKAGGFPWAPVGLTAGTCYLGISFFKSLGTKSGRMFTSLIQAFDEHGQGLVLRGPDFEWDSDEFGNSPHMTETVANNLVRLALDQYTSEMGQTPQRVVIHKTSRFWDAERQGIESELKRRVRLYDLVALAPQSVVRLMPANNYPSLRGTRFSVGDMDYLYTTGFIAELGQFHGLHVPSPLEIADHIGSDTPRDRILKEVLILTKMNWNSARLGGLWPITVRFSKLVGNILKELPSDIQPLANYKFYM